MICDNGIILERKEFKMNYLFDYLKNLFTFYTSKGTRIEEITKSDRIETPLQIINDPGLWKEIASTYNIDTVALFEWHFKNGVVHYFGTRDLKFNLNTLRPSRSSLIQNTLDPGLVLRIQNNPAYRKFSEENLSFSKCNYCTSFDLTQLQSDYLDYYFNSEYDDRITSDDDFQRLSKEDRVKIIKNRHNEILNDCRGLRYNM